MSSKPTTPPQMDPSGPFNLLRPLLLLSYTLYYLPHTILSLLLSLQFSTLLSPSRFQDAWFANFWVWFGPRSREVAAPWVEPLISHNAAGVCLDIGPGTGQWLSLFSRALNPQVTKIYGVEPNFGMHMSLRKSAVEAGLGDIYEVIGCGAEELGSKGGIGEGTVDTIITVQCLCSIPTPEKVIRELYPLLKPGGKWLVFEHVKTKYQGEFVGWWQRVVNWVWPLCFNGCDICRPTDEWLLRAGEWQEVSLKPGKNEARYDVVPHMIGTLTKRG